MASKAASKGKIPNAGKQVRTAARAAAASTSLKKTSLAPKALSKSAVSKTSKVKAQRTAQALATPAKKKALATIAAWPQSMSASGAVVAHSTGPRSAAIQQPARDGAHRPSKPALENPAVTAAPATVASWLEPWNQMTTAATRMMTEDPLKAAMDRQLQLYQAIARFSPLHLSMRIMQGLLPARDVAGRS